MTYAYSVYKLGKTTKVLTLWDSADCGGFTRGEAIELAEQREAQNPGTKFFAVRENL